MKKLLGLALLVSLTSACGMLYTDVRGPRAYRSSTPSEVKSSPTDTVVTGQACAQSALFLVAWGDAGYAAACRDALGAGMSDWVLYDVKSDSHVKSVLLGIYTKVCTRVTGKAARP
ncbi:MAG: TRL domain-containing protein [Elusimicrobiota bacterium]